ncbi:hypothetical protein NMG60_11026933 [Bertholletia excelsa]
MEVELVTEGASDDDTFNFDQSNDDYHSFEGERCGICMDIVIDRGVLDCCQHWFCFTCIDNWATITNLCPLCQNEFQLITCVPVYDTIGSSKVDEESSSREDDWCIEGKHNTLSFPSYYIDENAVICLEGDGCKIRSGLVTIEEDSNLDTSIACDSCDMWYHAFCVGFDPEGSCENSWLCPRCVANENPQNPDLVPVTRHKSLSEHSSNDSLAEAAFSRKVSVSIADAGETAVVVSMVERDQATQGPSAKLLPTLELEKKLKTEMLIASSIVDGTEMESPSTVKTGNQPDLKPQGLELCLSQDTSVRIPNILPGQSDLKITSVGEPVKKPSEPSELDGFVFASTKLGRPSPADGPLESSLDLHLGLSMACPLSADNMKKDTAEDQAALDVQQDSTSRAYILPDENTLPDLKDNILGITGAKRKLEDCCDDVHTVAKEETKADVETNAASKKVRSDRYSSVESQKSISAKENYASDIMSIVQGTDRRPLKDHADHYHNDKSSKARENAAGLRVKKVMRRAAEDKESSMLVQKLRKEIREAVCEKSSKESGEKLFDSELLAAFRAALAGSITEPAKKPHMLVVKAKRLMLQKGKIRENLTKKIYGIGGRRKRAWTRDCEIEFWKHRCIKAGRPEKIETLKSVLNLLRNNSDGKEIKQRTEGVAPNSILSRLYLADTSVFPRKEDIKPLSDQNTTSSVEDKGHSSMDKSPSLPVGDHNMKTLQMNNVAAQVGSPSSNNKGIGSTAVGGIKSTAASVKFQTNKCPKRPCDSSLNGSILKSEKEKSFSNDMKKDKRKWALEVLARKTATAGSNSTQEKKEDMAVLKGSYPLLAQLPSDMKPTLAPSRHNKIPISVRQAQLYRLTEHFLRKANLPVIYKTAETELAVVDAVNIEKQVADRANSKLVYVNLMSQELLHRSDNYCSVTESNPSGTSAVAVNKSEETMNDPSDAEVVEEALRNAGLLSDSPPNSPYCQMEEEINDKSDLSKVNGGEEPGNVFEADPNPDLDIYGDFEYDLEDEDLIGAGALRVSELQQEESKIKVVFSTFKSSSSNNASGLEGHERTTVSDMPKSSSCLQEQDIIGLSHITSTTGVTTEDCFHEEIQDHLTDGGAEPSLEECEELYGPDKEPFMKRFPEIELIKLCEPPADVVLHKAEHSESNKTVKASKSGSENPQASGGENASGSQTSEDAPKKEKLSDKGANKQCDGFNSICKKVETYIKEHIRPLCKSGVITVEQYRWAVGKTTDKVMKYHSKEKNANFLIKEGEKVKKLAQQYVEAAQQKEKK